MEIAQLINMSAHGVATPAPAEGRVILSRLPAGESSILSTSAALKLVIEGEEVHEIDGRPYVLQPGRMLFVAPGAPYRTTVRRNRDTLGLCVYLPTQARSLLNYFPTLGRAFIQAVDVNYVGRLLEHTASQMHSSPSDIGNINSFVQNISMNVKSAIQMECNNIAKLEMVKPTTRHKVLDRLECARAFLYGNTDRSVSLNELAAVAGMSTFHLARYFSDVFGAPPARYHRAVRLDLAAKRLAVGTCSVTDIALCAGYSDVSAFSHAFRRRFGAPPSAFST